MGVLSSLGSDSRHRAGAAGTESEANERAERIERSDFVDTGEIGRVGSSVDRTQVLILSCWASGSTGEVWRTSSSSEESEAREEMEVGLAGMCSMGGDSSGGVPDVHSEPSIPTSETFGLRGCRESEVLSVGT